MAVVLEGWSVVARRAAIEAALPGGLTSWFDIAPNRTACADASSCVVAFMVQADAAFLLRRPMPRRAPRPPSCHVPVPRSPATSGTTADRLVGSALDAELPLGSVVQFHDMSTHTADSPQGLFSASGDDPICVQFDSRTRA
jgi:hypothetical protein